MAKNKKDGVNSFEGLFKGMEQFEPKNTSQTENVSSQPIDKRVEVDTAHEAGENTMGSSVSEFESTVNSDVKITYDDGLEAQNEHIQKEIVSAKEKRETRSKTIQIKLPPSMYAEAKNRCNTIGISFNEGVNQLLRFWLSSTR